MDYVLTKKLTATFFQSDNGTEPVREWLLRLSKEDRKIVGSDLGDVEHSWPIGMPLVRTLKEGLFEVRGQLASGSQYRVFFSAIKGFMLLLHAFVKKTRKTPPKELQTARDRLRIWRDNNARINR